MSAAPAVQPSGEGMWDPIPAPATEEFRYVPLTELYESPRNPRKHFDQAALDELAASIRASGVLEALVVRRHPKGHAPYEIAAGSRRFRAAKLAGLEQVPVRIVPLDDRAFLEALQISNLQRDDLHPLEEADGFRSLMTSAGYDVARIAERVGRSVKYVYDRVKLLQLTKEAKQLFWDGTITAGHAILLARLTPTDQQRVIGNDKRDWRGVDGGLFQVEQAPGLELDDPVKPRSVRELAAWIDHHVRFDREAKDVPDLFPETARTVTAAKEEREKIVAITDVFHVDPEAKDDQERTYGPMSWRRADGEEGSKPCAHAVTGVIVVGPGRGEAFKVCIAKKQCDVHWKKERQEAKRRAKARADGEDVGAHTGRAAKQVQRWQEERKRAE